MTAGRPLRFLLLTLGGWAVIRVVVLWPEPVIELAAAPALPTSSAVAMKRRSEAIEPDLPPFALSTRAQAADAATAALRDGQAADTILPASLIASRRLDSMRSADAAAETMPDENGSTLLVSPPDNPPKLDPQSPAPRLPRLRGDTWLIARPGGGDSLAFGQLGASQVGGRLTYAVDQERSVALSARLSAPLEGRGREAALGVDWRPTALPVHLLVEQRLPLDGGQARPAAQLIGSVATDLPARFRLEMYAQAGAVHRRGGFADGTARLTRALLVAKAVTIDVGAGGWGAAQRGATRLDVGPTLGVALPARGGSVRLGLEYRVRVAGRARPDSGPAVTLGTSF